MYNLKVRFALLLTLGLILSHAAFGSGYGAYDDPKQDHTVSIGGVMGLPNLIGVELNYIHWSVFEFGAGVGYFPINSIAQSGVTLSPINFAGGTDNYTLTPAGTYSATTLSLSMKIFPFPNSGWFFRLGYDILQISASLTGALKDNSIPGSNWNNAVNGSINVSQPFITPAAGYRLVFSRSVYLDMSLGVSTLLNSSQSVSIGGLGPEVLQGDPAGLQNYNNAVTSVQNSVANGVQAFHNSFKFIPSALFSLDIAL